MNNNLKSIGVMAGVTVVLLVCYVFLGVSQGRKLGAVRKEYRSVLDKVDGAVERIESMPEVERDIQRLSGIIDELESRAVKEGELGAVVKAFEAEAYALGISGNGFAVKKLAGEQGEPEDESSGRLRKLRFKIELECSYAALVRYMAVLKKLPMYVSVERLQASTLQAAEGALRAEMIVRTYVTQ